MTTSSNTTMRYEIASRLRAAREAAGYKTAADAARAFGWGEESYRHHENGTRGISTTMAERYARAFRINVTILLGIGTITSPIKDVADDVVVVGEVAVGVWRDMALQSEPLRQSIPAPAISPNGRPKAVRVTDNSVSSHVAMGEYAIYISTGLTNTR